MRHRSARSQTISGPGAFRIDASQVAGSALNRLLLEDQIKAIAELALVAAFCRLRETFARRHTVRFSKVMGYVLRMADGKWCRISKRQFLALVNQHVVAEGYDTKGLMWQLMCQRIREAVTQLS